MQVADISCDTDTSTWKQSLRQLADSGKTSADIRRFWTPSAYNLEVFENMPVRRVPWFVVADSTGRVLYRGSSVAEARNQQNNTLKKAFHNTLKTIRPCL